MWKTYKSFHKMPQKEQKNGNFFIGRCSLILYTNILINIYHFLYQRALVFFSDSNQKVNVKPEKSQNEKKKVIHAQKKQKN